MNNDELKIPDKYIQISNMIAQLDDLKKEYKEFTFFKNGISGYLTIADNKGYGIKLPTYELNSNLIEIIDEWYINKWNEIIKAMDEIKGE